VPGNRAWPRVIAVRRLLGFGGLALGCLASGCQDADRLVGSPEAAASAPVRTNPAPAASAPTPTEAVEAPGPAKEVSAAPRLVPGGAGNASGSFGMVVSVELEATQIGVRVLEMGGNAVDAAVATAYALAVTHPNAGNLGGGGFMLIARPGEPVVALDFREQAPSKTNMPAFLRMLSQGAKGPGASAVPGTVAGLNLAEQRFGRLPLEQVVLPALELARHGHRIGRRQADALEQAWPELRRDAAARAIFGGRSGPLAEGERLVQKDLADTLERIAREGDAGFYAGPTAQMLVRAMRDDGLIRQQDLAAYRAVVREPLRFVYRGLDVATMPPPSSGGLAVAQTLALLEQLGVERFPAGSADELHFFVEASKRAQARRRYELVDPDSDPAGMSPSALAERLTPRGLLALTPPIDPASATPSAVVYPRARRMPPELPHTTHLSVVDALGTAVSCTVTLSTSFGARYVAPGTGVVMNNSLAAFGGVGLNLPKPGRRMLSSMSPTLVSHEGNVMAVLGSPGGDTIPSTVVQVLRHLVDHGMTIDQAVEAPRIHHGFSPDEVRVERLRPIDAAVVAELEARGHRVVAAESPIGDANDIIIVGGVAYGHADSREGGLALGPSKLPPAMQLPARTH
jgi:gamma-glutamyltranspeptidase/glutathione hydrolase